MNYSYPHRSHQKQTLTEQAGKADYRTWQSDDLQVLVTSIHNPVIEIGGPTQGGFYFLDDITLNSKPIITNISLNPMPLSEDAAELATEVDEVIDATKMSYADGSIGIFLLAAMSISSDWWVELSEEEKEKAEPTFEAEFANARFEMGRVAAGIQDPKTVKDAQRVKIYLEMARCLDKNGLLFTDGSIEDIAILKQIGFEIVACLQIAEEYGMSYEFVAMKQS